MLETQMKLYLTYPDFRKQKLLPQNKNEPKIGFFSKSFPGFNVLCKLILFIKFQHKSHIWEKSGS